MLQELVHAEAAGTALGRVDVKGGRKETPFGLGGVKGESRRSVIRNFTAGGCTHLQLDG